MRGFHGVHPEEREQGQDFVVDVELVVPLDVAVATDDVLGTVHYGELARAIMAEVERDPVDLIETVADRVARLVLADRGWSGRSSRSTSRRRRSGCRSATSPCAWTGSRRACCRSSAS